MKKLLILLKHTRELDVDWGISGNVSFLGVYLSYKKVDGRILKDVEGVSIAEEENKPKKICDWATPIYKCITTEEDIRDYIVIEADADSDYEDQVASYWYIE